MVRFVRLDFLPIAEATKVLNLDSFGLDEPVCACNFESETRLDCEEFVRFTGPALKDLDLHHDLPCEVEAMGVVQKGEGALLKESDYC